MREAPVTLRAGAVILIGRLPTLPHTRAHSTIGAEVCVLKTKKGIVKGR
jgi:hypothetical protein